MRIHVDRDSVSMGDDCVPHDESVDVDPAAPLAELFAAAGPRVGVHGGSTWICTWDGEPFAVYASSWGTGRVWDERLRTVADLRRGGTGGPREPHELHFRYWTQLDPDWLLERLRAGAPLDRRALEAEAAPLQARRVEEEWRRREAERTERLLSPATTGVLTSFGARIDLHADLFCRFSTAGGEWRLQRLDTMTLLWTPAGRSGSFRPTTGAELWVVALVAAEWRRRAGLPPVRVPPRDGVPSPERSPSLWSVRLGGGSIAQLPSEADARAFCGVAGRPVHEVAALFRAGA